MNPLDKTYFEITYHLYTDTEEEVTQKVEHIALEQSVELPRSVLSASINERIVGKPGQILQLDEHHYRVSIQYPLENAGAEIVQFLNVLFGNVSLIRGVQIHSASWDPLKHLCKGPAYGISHIRHQLGIPTRALSCTALKPMGYTSDQLAELAREFALGGIDIIKDDHGLANQAYAPYAERVERIQNSVKRANEQTGYTSYYFPNVTAGITDLERRIDIALEHGCKGVLFIPQLASLESMHWLAHQKTGLMIMAHPAFSGSYVTSTHQGFTPAFLYGQLYRALGADFSIYPNAGGRFSFSLDQCQQINHDCRTTASPFQGCFPTPGGGVKWEQLPEWIERYTNDTVFLMGGSLYQYPDGIRAVSNHVRRSLQDHA